LLGGDRVGEVLELVDELEEAVCVSFHVITFGRATDGKLGRGQERLFAPSAMVYTLKAHGRKAAKPSDAATAFGRTAWSAWALALVRAVRGSNRGGTNLER
jgi:hypothetical protein